MNVGRVFGLLRGVFGPKAKDRSERTGNVDSTDSADDGETRAFGTAGDAVSCSPSEEFLVTDGGAMQAAASDLPGFDVPSLLHDQELIAAMGVAAFTIDTQRRVVSWNGPMAELTGVEPDEVLGTKNAIGALYENNQPPEKAKSLAGWVLEAPRNADTHFEGQLPYEIERVETGYEEPLYRIETQISPRGGERVVRFYAAPIYRDGELVRIIETAHDRTEEVKRHEAISGLVDEVTETLREIRNGRLGARASFEDPHDRIDPRLLGVVTELNDTADDLEGLVTQVDEASEELATSADQAEAAARRIDEHTQKQAEQLSTISREMQDFSARMEEVASTAEQISTKAHEAKEATESSTNAGQEAQDAIGELVESSDQLVTRIEELESGFDELEEIIEIIDGVADQTNLLAVNANIEAARVDSNSDGFAVVANEIKNLAEETSEHTDDVSENIGRFRSQTEAATEAVTQSRNEIGVMEEKIESILEVLLEIDDAVGTTADEITTVAEANDQQATAVETVTRSVEEVQERANDMESATDEIVVAIEQQNAAIDDLVENVDQFLDGRA